MPRAFIPFAFVLFLFFFAVLAVSAPSFAQGDGTIHLPPTISQGPGMGNIPVRSGDDVQKEQMKKAQELRQEEIRRDTEKLFQLSSELRDYIEKSDRGVLSLDAIKKAEQIEKLAKSVKGKMKLSY